MSGCVSGQEECHLETQALDNLFVGLKDFVNQNWEKYFEIININNATIPTQSVPDYPFPIEAPDFVTFDSEAGVVRACGGNIPFKLNLKDTSTDQCFTYDGFEWKPMASLGMTSFNNLYFTLLVIHPLLRSQLGVISFGEHHS